MKRVKSLFFPLVLSSPSGGGKTAVKEKLREVDGDFRFSVTCTTRPKRAGEVEGKDYYFVTEAEFKRMRSKGLLLEWAKVHGNYYGTPVKSVKDLLSACKTPVMTIDVAGAKAVKKIFPGAVTVFLLPPDLKTLKERLKKRNETPANIKVRLETAKKELKQVGFFDYFVVNDNLREAVASVYCIVKSESLKTFRNPQTPKVFRQELLKSA